MSGQDYLWRIGQYDETKTFLEYVEQDYEKSVSNRAKTSFKKK